MVIPSLLTRSPPLLIQKADFGVASLTRWQRRIFVCHRRNKSAHVFVALKSENPCLTLSFLFSESRRRSRHHILPLEESSGSSSSHYSKKKILARPTFTFQFSQEHFSLGRTISPWPNPALSLVVITYGAAAVKYPFIHATTIRSLVASTSRCFVSRFFSSSSCHSLDCLWQLFQAMSSS